MKKVFVLGLLFALTVSLNVFAQDQKTKEVDVKSTQGLEVSQETAKTVAKLKPAKSNPAKEKRKNRNKYLKNLHKTDKAKYKKQIKEDKLEFYNKRLEIKKQQLEELTSDNEVKGEKEQ